ncbi:MAG: lipase maturation factor family protein, partial [Planctomycetes bacterium]|nr:lipase maturation factor family protein [Planctomycetota bacterium]
MPTRIDTPPSDRPLMVYDGDCQFCCASINRWREASGQQIDYAPYQEVGAQFPEVDEKDFQRAVHFIDTEGAVSRGAEALFRATAHCGRKRWLLWLYKRLPPFALAAEMFYRLVAVSRTPITIVHRIWYGKELKPPTYHISSALFLRFLGIVYLIAFVSLWTQIDGLIGDNGILPAQNYLSAVERHFSEQRPPASPEWRVPTLAWISPHDGFLHLLCGAGTLLSLLLILGVLPMPALILLWLCYLSLFHVGQAFLSFQWDILLLETGFLAIFLAPFAFRSRLGVDRHPPRLAIWLVWWLLFRLMFESGAVKLTWNDSQLGPDGAPVANTWELLTAMDYHYWTQPLPTWISWYAAKLPPWIQRLSVVGVLIIELVLPFLIFGPRLLRYIAFSGFMLLMLLIAGTGNYTFFNLLTVLFALTLLDDRIWPRFLRRRISGADAPVLASHTRWRSFLLMPFVGLTLLLGALQLRESVAPQPPQPSLESRWNIAQFHLVNSYGLFRRMTETRPEIMIEGSANGKDWREYRF